MPREWRSLRKRLTGHKLVGVHATTIDNLGPLMTEGVSHKKMASGHGVGKGSGFYIIPTPRGTKDLAKTETSAKFWDPSIVAVYLPEDCQAVDAEEGQTVETLEQESQSNETRRFYIFGTQEGVIPPSLFPQIVLVSKSGCGLDPVWWTPR